MPPNREDEQKTKTNWKTVGWHSEVASQSLQGDVFTVPPTSVYYLCSFDQSLCNVTMQHCKPTQLVLLLERFSQTFGNSFSERLFCMLQLILWQNKLRQSGYMVRWFSFSCSAYHPRQWCIPLSLVHLNRVVTVSGFALSTYMYNVNWIWCRIMWSFEVSCDVRRVIWTYTVADSQSEHFVTVGRSRVDQHITSIYSKIGSPCHFTR